MQTTGNNSLPCQRLNQTRAILVPKSSVPSTIESWLCCVQHQKAKNVWNKKRILWECRQASKSEWPSCGSQPKLQLHDSHGAFKEDLMDDRGVCQRWGPLGSGAFFRLKSPKSPQVCAKALDLKICQQIEGRQKANSNSLIIYCWSQSHWPSSLIWSPESTLDVFNIVISRAKISIIYNYSKTIVVPAVRQPRSHPRCSVRCLRWFRWCSSRFLVVTTAGVWVLHSGRDQSFSPWYSQTSLKAPGETTDLWRTHRLYNARETGISRRPPCMLDDGCMFSIFCYCLLSWLIDL